jgi:phosphoglycolate/pyridoxal phosphate phosphatase family enzyme
VGEVIRNKGIERGAWWLEDVDGILCDLDGVVYRGGRAIPGAAQAIAALRKAGKRFLFCTNNSGATVFQYLEKLSKLGITADANAVLTSAVVTAATIARRGLAGRTAIVVGRDGIREELLSVGVSIDDDPKSESADLVVVGWDPSFDYVAMRRASTAARNGATFVGTNEDATYPHSTGLWPGAGAILASIQVAAGRSAEIMGKPHPAMMDEAARRLEPARRIAVIGDRIDTDIAGGLERGWKTILVLSGVTNREDLHASGQRPDLVIQSIAELAPH